MTDFPRENPLTEPAGPTDRRPRIAALDVLRGLAILGTFAMNVWVFAYPSGPVGFLLDGFATADPVETVLRGLANGKFLALLTLLFGVGMELQYRSAMRTGGEGRVSIAASASERGADAGREPTIQRGRRWPGRYLVRAAVLFVEGLLHYLLVFEFDVLMAYAITSMLVAYLIGRSERVVRAWMLGVGTVYLALLGGITALLLSTPEDTLGLSGLGAESSVSGTSIGAESSVSGTSISADATASWTDQVALRVSAFPLLRAETVLIVPSAVVLFLLGSRLLRAGAFSATEAGARIRRRLMVLGLGVGLPLNALTVAAGPAWALLDRYLLPPLVGLGLLGLVTDLVLRAGSTPGPVRRALAAVGRTALSCYVLQNLVAGALCYGWGLGLAARFAGTGPLWVIALWAGVCALCTALAVLWLRRFERGPVELVMHRVVAPRVARPAAVTR